MNNKIKTVLAVGFVAGTVTALVLLDQKLKAVSATQDNILLTLADQGIIENLHFGK